MSAVSESDVIHKMYVVKRNGKKAPLRLDEITKRNEELTKLLSIDIDEPYLSTLIAKYIYPGITTSEIDDLSSEYAFFLSCDNPDYDKLAAYIACDNLLKNTPKTFLECFNILLHNTSKISDEKETKQPLIGLDTYAFAIANIDRIERSIDFSKDYNFDYFGIQTLKRGKYLQRSNGVIIENPSYMRMRMALGMYKPVYENGRLVMEGDIDKAIKTYNNLSNNYYIHGSPVLFNCGTEYTQNASCFLMSIPDDLIEICKYYGIIAGLSKRGGGIGIDLSGIRAKGSHIVSTGGEAAGVIPIARQLENFQVFSQGKRNGSFSINLQDWHAEIEAFLELRLPGGDDKLRARNIMTAFWTSRLFWKRVKNDEMYSLFCPTKTPDLLEKYGDEFEAAYIEYERKKMYQKQIKARDIFALFTKSIQMCGTPYVLNKDEFCEKNNQKNIGVPRCSNLCCEIGSRSGGGAISVCNLASIALPRFVKERKVVKMVEMIDTTPRSFTEDGKIPIDVPGPIMGLTEATEQYFDYEHMGECVENATENCDRLISSGMYPADEAKNCNLDDRPIGIGIQGLSDVFQKMGFPWESKESMIIDEHIMMNLYYYSLKKSCELAKKYGTYKGFRGSPASKGILQFHMWKHTPDPNGPISPKMWEDLIADIVKHGLRNSLTTALMPTASTSQILGNCESIEAYTYNMYSRNTMAGTFYVTNKNLVADLKRIGKWDRTIFKKIRMDKGSVKDLDIPEKMKEVYKTVWEIKQKCMMDHCAIRAPYIDHSQSFNIHFPIITTKKLYSAMLYAAEKGLKTFSYYCRGKAAADANNFIDDDKDTKNELSPVELLLKRSSEPETKEIDISIYMRTLGKMDEKKIDLAVNKAKETVESVAENLTKAKLEKDIEAAMLELQAMSLQGCSDCSS